MPSVAECLGALVKIGQIDKATSDRAEALFEQIRAGAAPVMGEASADAVAALKAAEAMLQAAGDRKFAAALNARSIVKLTDRVMADPVSRAVGVVNIFQRFEASPVSGGVNIASRSDSFLGEIQKPFSEAMERYASRWARLKKDLVGPRNMVRELFGQQTGDEVARAAAEGWRASNDIAVQIARTVGKVFTCILLP